MVELKVVVVERIIGDPTAVIVRLSRPIELDDLLGVVITTKDSLESAHCVTCQCNRHNQEPPSPGNVQSKSWHQTAGGKPPAG